MLELQLISSMYPDQVTFYDPVIDQLLVSSDLREALAAIKPSSPADPVEFVFLPTSGRLELNFTLPVGYPNGAHSLDAHIRLLDTTMTSSTLKNLQNKANSSLKAYLNENSCQANVLGVIQWVDEFEQVLQVDDQKVECSNQGEKNGKLIILIIVMRVALVIESGTD